MKLKNLTFLFSLALVIGVISVEFSHAQNTNNMPKYAEDFHSFSNPQQVRVTNVDLDWTILFDKKIVQGTATLGIERTDKFAPIILDTRDLKIEKAETSSDGKTFKTTTFKLGAADKFLGSSLTVELPKNAKFVRIAYSSSPNASGLQWLEPSQTAGKKQPFMFSQAQAIHAR